MSFTKKHDEFRRFGFAGVPPNNMDIIRAFVEGLTRYEGYLLAASHLHHDRAFQHIDKCMDRNCPADTRP